jgi:hypothetical protein
MDNSRQIFNVDPKLFSQKDSITKAYHFQRDSLFKIYIHNLRGK